MRAPTARADRRGGRRRPRRPTRSRERRRRSRCTRCTGRGRRPGRRAPRRSVGLGVARDEVVGRHQHPRRAGAALGAAAGEERGLERRRAAGTGEALDRLDAPALDLARGDEAGADLLPVEPHGARAAVAGVAADLGAGQAEVLAQDVDEAPPPVRAHLDAAAVDLEPEGGVGDHAATPVITPRPRRPRAGPASAPRPSGSRRCPRTSSIGASGERCSIAGTVAEGRPGSPPAELALEAAQPPGDRGARPDRDPRVDDDPAVDHEDRRHRDDRDHEVRARAELEERGPGDARRPGLGRPGATGDLRHPQARDQLAGPQVGPPVARARSPRSARRACHRPRRDLDRGVQRQQVGQPVGRRRGVDDVAAHGSRVLDLAPADRAGRRPQPVELGRERRLREVRPRRQRRDPPRVARRRRRRAAREAP